MPNPHLDTLKEATEEVAGKAVILEEEFRNLAETFNEDCKRAINEKLREMLIQEIDETVKELIEEAERREKEFRMDEEFYKKLEYSDLIHPKVMAISAIYVRTEDGRKHFSFDTCELDKEGVVAFVKKLEKDNIRYATLEEFRRRLESVKSSISSGKLDEFLRLRAEEIVWEIMGYGGKLLPIISSSLSKAKEAR